MRAEGAGPATPASAASLQAGPRVRVAASVGAARGQPDPGGRRPPGQPPARYLSLGAARRVPAADPLPPPSSLPPAPRPGPPAPSSSLPPRLTGLAPPHSGRSPSAHSATSPFQLSASVQRSGPRLRLSPGHSQGPAGSPSLRLGSGPAARHAGRSVSPWAGSPSCLLGQGLRLRDSGHAQSVCGKPFPHRAKLRTAS